MKNHRFYLAVLALLLGFSAHAVEESHPGIQNAIAALEQTKKGLENGEHGFGGHRSKAIEDIDAALKELHEALNHAKDHPEEVKAPGQ